MNDKLDKIRRRMVKDVDEEQKNLLKNQRFFTFHFGEEAKILYSLAGDNKTFI